MTLDPDTQKNVDLWLKGDYDKETKEEIESLLKSDPQKIVDAFYTTLTFGTGGLRGVMGIGSNRMNRYTIRAATQGVANYLKKTVKGKLSFFIGYDSRHGSREFAEESAKVLAGNGIQVFLCQEMRPTPYVSFGCRKMKCSGGIMITASHNPPEYNGYKVYWDDGGQVLPPHDKGIIEEVGRISGPEEVHAAESLSDPLIKEVKEEMDTAYCDAIRSLALYPEENHSHGGLLRVVYTSLHGTGITLVPRVLENWGFTNLALVEKQCRPDGSFPTVRSPNPEDKQALESGIALMMEEERDLLIATDPDADRVGVAVRHKGKPHLLTGNQVACILLEHICHALTEQGRMPQKAAFVKTIGTSELFRAIVEGYGKTCFDTLTGFKYIAELMRKWEEAEQGYQYIFGGEESYGYLYGNCSHDKDAILSAALICEAALHAKRQGKTLVDLLQDLYLKYGVYVEKLLSLNFPDSKSGKKQMEQGMKKIRANSPKSVCGIPVISTEDYLTSEKIIESKKRPLPLTQPKSDVLLYWLADGSKIMIRPSGTEAKVKLYCGVTSKTETLAACEKHATAILNELRTLLEE